MTTARTRRWSVLALVAAAGVATIALQAQGQQPLFTGTSTGMEGKDLSVARRRFEPGARSYWHSHEKGQLLYVESGRMWTQRRGQGKRDLGPGDSDYTGPNIEHWHGAAPAGELIQVNVGFGGGAKWLEAVSDADYRK